MVCLVKRFSSKERQLWHKRNHEMETKCLKPGYQLCWGQTSTCVDCTQTLLKSEGSEEDWKYPAWGVEEGTRYKYIGLFLKKKLSILILVNLLLAGASGSPCCASHTPPGPCEPPAPMCHCRDQLHQASLTSNSSLKKTNKTTARLLLWLEWFLSFLFEGQSM